MWRISRPAPDPRVKVRSPPENIWASKRDPQTALLFLETFEDDATRLGEGAARAGSTVTEREVLSAAWYHTIELPGGIVTRGMFDHRHVVDHYGIPDDLSGKRCLDVACSDGFWSFEFERRGAEVTAVDVASPSDYDLPTGSVTSAAGRERRLNAFSLAHRALGSHVKRLPMNLYALDPADLGTFDLVHSGDVLLHLERPLEALRRYRDMTSADGTALITDSFDPDLEGNVTRYFGGFEGLLWWMPSLDCLVQMVYDAGFGAAEVVSIFNLPAWDQDEGYWRAVIKATL